MICSYVDINKLSFMDGELFSKLLLSNETCGRESSSRQLTLNVARDGTCKLTLIV